MPASAPLSSPGPGPYHSTVFGPETSVSGHDPARTCSISVEWYRRETPGLVDWLVRGCGVASCRAGDRPQPSSGLALTRSATELPSPSGCRTRSPCTPYHSTVFDAQTCRSGAKPAQTGSISVEWYGNGAGCGPGSGGRSRAPRWWKTRARCRANHPLTYGAGCGVHGVAHRVDTDAGGLEAAQRSGPDPGIVLTDAARDADATGRRSLRTSGRGIVLQKTHGRTRDAGSGW